MSELLFLIAYFSVLDAQLVQSPNFLKASAGKSVSLSCVIFGATASCYQIVWHFQRHTEAPRRLNSQGRFNIASGTFQSDCALSISNLDKSDSGIYHCSKCIKDITIFGQGTTLIVADESVDTPSVFIFPPSAEEDKALCTATLVCLVCNVPSDKTHIFWNISGKVIDGISSPGVITTNEEYCMTNELIMPSNTWTSETSYICVVEASPGNFLRKSMLRGNHFYLQSFN
ncbi:immunoglobulin kappa light chain-like [Protopterus annectens]|uniref:immunoglobulin kappa light chain-like n=1 Tax=Protopterus annectens TaxID=7888 RepID=UPI001CFC0ED7|nr:immunoglobulin kappa light chain-like [Protopterus annectens]